MNRNPGNSNDNKADQVLAAQILTVAQGSPIVLLSGVFAAGLLAAGMLWDPPGHIYVRVISAWAALILIGLMIGVFFAHRVRRAQQISAQAVIKAGRWMVVNSGACGVIWGSTAVLSLPTSHPEQDAFVLAGIAMVLMGGAAHQAAYRPMVCAFTILLTSTFLLGLANSQGKLLGLYIAAYGLLCFVTLRTSRNHEDTLRKQIVLNIERETFIRDSQEEYARSEAARQASERAAEELRVARDEAIARQEESVRARAAAELERMSAVRERERAEIEKQRAVDSQRETELLSRAKSAFLAAASHDMRSSIHSCGIYLGLLTKYNEDPQLSEWLKLCSLSQTSLQTLLNSMLDMSKIESGTIRPILAIRSMGQLLDSLKAEFRTAVPAGVEFVINECLIDVYADEALLRRILLNFISNALRYTREGWVTVRCRVLGSALRCAVFDTGIGIPAEEQKKIYEPFYQIAQQGSGAGMGLGIGLTIVRDLCVLLNYPLRVRSVPGKGSVFSIDVPIATHGHDAKTSSAEHAKQLLTGKLIVLIDNKASDLGATAHVLRELGCGVISVMSSRSALKKLAEDRIPDLILADYGLDGETGLDAIKVISEKLMEMKGAEHVIPSLLISGDTRPEVLREISDHGYRVVHKPADAEKLRLSLIEAFSAS